MSDEQRTIQKLKEAGRIKPFPKDLKERHEERLKTQSAERTDRIAGFYWVKTSEARLWNYVQPSEWVVARLITGEHFRPYWNIPGNDCGFTDDEFKEIRERVAEPEYAGR